jgi:uncharacterized protein YlxP (DUF503 family)
MLMDFNIGALDVNVEDTLQRTSVTLAAVSHDAWAADVCATP